MIAWATKKSSIIVHISRIASGVRWGEKEPAPRAIALKRASRVQGTGCRRQQRPVVNPAAHVAAAAAAAHVAAHVAAHAAMVAWVTDKSTIIVDTYLSTRGVR